MKRRTQDKISVAVIAGTAALVFAATLAGCHTASVGTPPASPSTTPAITPGGPATTIVPAPATPAPPKPKRARPRTLLSMSGSGLENSAPFIVSTSPVTATYSYNCSSFGSSGNFAADMETADQASLGSDDQSIANALGSGASDVTTTLYPTDIGGQYHLTVDSECSWSVTLTEPGS